VRSSTPTTEELLNRAKDLIRQNREYLEHFNAVIDQLHKREEEFQAEHPPGGDSLFVVTRPDRLIEARIMRNG